MSRPIVSRTVNGDSGLTVSLTDRIVSSAADFRLIFRHSSAYITDYIKLVLTSVLLRITGVAGFEVLLLLVQLQDSVVVVYTAVLRVLQLLRAGCTKDSYI